MKLLILSALSFFISCSPLRNKNEKAEAVAHLYFVEVWNKGKVELLDSILTQDYINHTPSAPTTFGPAGLKPIVKAIRKAFPDLHFIIEDVIAANGYITIRTVMTGTHKDSLFGIPPTGRSVRVNQINIEKLRDGKIAEHWRVTDELAMMKQLSCCPSVSAINIVCLEP